MPNIDLLLWAVRALSFFNTIAFLWLGMAVLLNARERKPVTLATGVGLIGAGLFFAVHSTLVGREMGTFEPELAFWWHFLWLLFVLPPYGWYIVANWFTGALDTGQHRGELAVVTLLGIAVLVPMAVQGALPTYDEIALGPQNRYFWLRGIPVVVLAYPVYSALCFVLALVALNRPGSSRRFMGDLGRRRAKPWLAAASVVLLAVSVTAGATVGWGLYWTRWIVLDLSSPIVAARLLGIDMGVSAMLALSVVLVGRAIVSYEIFTGTVLPRSGFRRHWWNSLILAAGFGVLMGGSLGLTMDPIYRLILATLLIAVFYALLSWRSYIERERNIQSLRPFVASERLYERLLKSTPLEVDVEGQFRALCEGVLGARVAHLVPLGPMAPLIERSLSYPVGALPPASDLGSLARSLRTPGVLTIPLDPSRFGGAVWAVPLWSERGPIGTLLLGEKKDGGLYVQEEIEVARSACERLIDTQASAGMARRLMATQRQRMGEAQLLDRQARRVLHDEVLPQLHTALLALGTGDGATDEAAQGIAAVHHRISDLLRAMPTQAPAELSRLGLAKALRNAVDADLAGAFDSVIWEAEPEAERVARELSPLVAEVAFGAAREAIRNAARHGRGTEQARPLHVSVSLAWQDSLRISIEDDGVGMSATSADNTGSGQGLALHSTMMAVIGGTLSIEPAPTGGTRVTLTLPREAST